MKRLDLSVLPDDFLCERSISGGLIWDLAYARYCNSTLDYRPALNHWHFNDGSMVLPDGLVVEFKIRSYNISSNHIGVVAYEGNAINHNGGMWSLHPEKNMVEALKILGVTAEHREHGEELGMRVVEL